MSFRFRNFKVYQDSVEAYKLVVQLTRNFPKDFYHLAEQIRRAGLSVILNIAEGSAKNSDKDFNRYLGNSLGSSNETVAGLEVAYCLKLISQEETNEACEIYSSITSQLGGLSKKLKS
jgi:four helix bundle protein